MALHLVEFPSLGLDVPDVFPAASLGIFAIPIICAGALVVLWAAAHLYEDLGNVAGMFRKQSRAPASEDGDGHMEYNVATSVTVFILYASLANILMHTVAGNLVGVATESDMPFLKVIVGLGRDYYLTFLNLMSAVSLCINTLVPIA